MANSRFTNALNRVAQEVPPIWMMRQAGRYHQHYQKLRAQHGFVDLCKKTELATEVTMGPIEEFDFDVAILFSDLLFPLEALGMGLKYDPGPVLSHALDESNIKDLLPVDEAIVAMQFQKEAVQSIRKRLPEEKSLIGFVGGPWTLFTYAVEGKHAGNLLSAKTKLSLFRDFCEKMTPFLIKNIQLQLDGGAEVVMVFDTAAGELSAKIFTELVAPQLQELVKAFPGKLGYYAKGVVKEHYTHATFQQDEWTGLGFDHRWQLTNCFDIGRGFVQGNFDQALLFNQPEVFEKLLRQYLEPFQKISVEERAGWVCGLGHGVLPKTPEANVKRFVQLVREIFS